MKKADLEKLTKSIRSILIKRSPEILVGIGITGMVSTTIMAVRATPKAAELIQIKKEEKEAELSKLEIVKTTWKCYIPAAITGSVSIACIIGASRVNAKRNATLATAYTISKTALSEYKEQVIETVGEKKENEIEDKVAKKKIEDNPVSKKDILITEKGNSLCYDSVSGRYFYSDIDTIKRAENYVNKKMLNEMYLSLNEFYYEIGLKQTELGNELGWNIDDGLLDIHYSSQIAEDGRPCLVLGYHVAPRYNYSSNY